LWEGKSYALVRNNMRAEEYSYPDESIAHALFAWRKLDNVTEIGRLLSPEGLTDSAYYRRGKRLLEETAELNITTA
jgi:hypothetical protein